MSQSTEQKSGSTPQKTNEPAKVVSPGSSQDQAKLDPKSPSTVAAPAAPVKADSAVKPAQK